MEVTDEETALSLLAVPETQETTRIDFNAEFPVVGDEIVDYTGAELGETVGPTEATANIVVDEKTHSEGNVYIEDQVNIVQDVRISKRKKKGVASNANVSERKKDREKGNQSYTGSRVSEPMAIEEKPKSKKRTEITEVKAIEFVQNIIDRMNTAVDEDKQAVASRSPGIAKLILLDEALHEIAKPKWMHWFLKEGICKVFGRWLTPVGTSIPNLTIRSRILQLLKKLPIQPVHFQGTDLGFRLIALWKSPEETEENRAAIRDIVQTVLRPVFGARDNLRSFDTHLDDSNELPVPSNSRIKQKIDGAAGSQPKLGTAPRRARVPLQASHTFKVMPKSAAVPLGPQEVSNASLMQNRLQRVIATTKRSLPNQRRLSKVVMPT